MAQETISTGKVMIAWEAPDAFRKVIWLLSDNPRKSEKAEIKQEIGRIKGNK